ncbi:MAG: hypothetical protein ACI82S_002692 [Patiriisocius sp.]|jgi:hypothetical protein
MIKVTVMNKRKFLHTICKPALYGKSKAFALMFGIAVCFPSYALIDYKALSKELEIMDSVMATALKQASESEIIVVRDLRTTYLAGQGVVYSIATSNKSRHLRFGDNIFISAPPVPPFPSRSVTSTRIFEEIEQVEIEMAIEHAKEDAEHAFGRDNQNLRETRSSARNIEWRLRDFERRAQDLEFELQTADKTRKEEIQSQVTKLNAQNKSLNEQKLKLQEVALKIEAEQKQKRELQKAEMVKANKAFLDAFEQSVSNNLCRFGAGLRALPKNEHITFILNNFNNADPDGNTDRIYIFTAADVTRCVQDKIDVKQLLAKATVYNF